MTDLVTKATNINRTQNHRYRFLFNGLLPNTKHKMYIDGVDYTFATRQLGKDFGDDLISGPSGELDVFVLYEIPFSRDQNFELPQTQSVAYQEQIYNNQESKTYRVVNNYVLFEVKSADENSYAQYSMRNSILLTAGAVDTLYPIT